jgi:lipoate-protein ligase A
METWFLLRSGAGSAAENMALDETLLVSRLDRPVLRFYSWREPAASFGYFQRYDEVSRSTSLRPVVRRPTGGGIVPHDCDWTYSLVFPPTHLWYSLKALDSYGRVHQWVRAAFSDVSVFAELAVGRAVPSAPGQCFAGAEQFDVVLAAQKIAGAAQRRTRDGLLIQGSIQPPPGVLRDEWEAAFCARATADWKIQWNDWHLPKELAKLAAELAAVKYSDPAYNQRR